MTQILQITTELLEINRLCENRLPLIIYDETRLPQICDDLSHLQMICGHLFPNVDLKSDGILSFFLWSSVKSVSSVFRFSSTKRH